MSPRFFIGLTPSHPVFFCWASAARHSATHPGTRSNTLGGASASASRADVLLPPFTLHTVLSSDSSIPFLPAPLPFLAESSSFSYVSTSLPFLFPGSPSPHRSLPLCITVPVINVSARWHEVKSVLRGRLHGTKPVGGLV